MENANKEKNVDNPNYSEGMQLGNQQLTWRFVDSRWDK